MISHNATDALVVRRGNLDILLRGDNGLGGLLIEAAHPIEAADEDTQ